MRLTIRPLHELALQWQWPHQAEAAGYKLWLQTKFNLNSSF